MITLIGISNPIEEIFTHIYQHNLWLDSESISGTGSNLEQTQIIRKELPELLKQYNINVLLDAPCGDCYWISKIDLNVQKYIGIDIVADLIEENKNKFPDFTFYKLDIISDPLPKADLILCRDCLVHFSEKHVMRALKNIKKSGSTYLLTTHFPKWRKNIGIETGNWRPINFTKSPYNSPQPLVILNEGLLNTEMLFSSKSLAL